MVKQRPNWLNWRSGISFGVGLVGLGIAIALATGKLKAGIGGGKTEVTSVKTTVGGVETTTTTTPQEAKTLWDWLSLAGVPVSLAGLGFWLQIQQQKQNDLQKERELEQTKQLAAVERDIAEQNRQEEALQNYYDKISALLVDKNLLAIAAKREILVTDAKPDTTALEERELLDVSVDVIRARTLTTLRRLDSTRKTSLIQFLLEAEVISKLKLGLQNANLEGANLEKAHLEKAHLKGANLGYAHMEGANLYEAHLEGADLHGAHLERTHLEGANLDYAHLEGANLDYAHLKGADLRGARLEGANLYEAHLEGADLRGARLYEAHLDYAHLEGANLGYAHLEKAHLKGANLTKAIGLTKEQLEGQDPPYLCSTKLPEGIDIDPNRDCARLARDFPDPD